MSSPFGSTRRVGPIALAAVFTLAAAARGDDSAKGREAREALGRGVKYRILVDKVMQPTKGWVTEEWMVEEAVRHGFNVFVPRKGNDRLDEVRRVAGWCRDRGIFHMPWMRGTLRAPKGKEADGKRHVWADGTEEPLWSPNSDAFWEWTNRNIIGYAKIAAENPHCVGVFLDYENYTPLRKPNCYDLSYDDLILKAFATARNLDLPDLPLDARKAWLQKQGLHDAFAALQVAHWRERCRTLREAVDEHDPGFRFCVYPAPGTPFMVQAIYPEWATKRAPLVLADACTYGNRSGALLLENALKANRDLLVERRKIPEAAGIPFVYTGGIDPAVRGAAPEFSGKNADCIAQATDGYWVFYEGPEYAYDGPYPHKNHRAYFRWFARANRDIAAGRFALWKEPRETPDPALQAVRNAVGQLDRAGAAPFGDAALSPEARKKALCLRGRHAIVIRTKKGEAVAGRIQVRQIGRYTSPCAWLLMDPAGKRAGLGRVEPGETADIRGPAGPAGLWTLVLETGRNAARFYPENRTACLLGPQVDLIHAQPRAYFLPMPNAARLRIAVESPSPGETVAVVLRDPDGQAVAEADTVKKERVEVAAKVTEATRGRPWSLDLGKTGKSGCEDMTVTVLEGAVPLLATDPARLLRLERAVAVEAPRHPVRRCALAVKPPVAPGALPLCEIPFRCIRVQVD